MPNVSANNPFVAITTSMEERESSYSFVQFRTPPETTRDKKIYKNREIEIRYLQ
jgi:hypothetical protein